MLAVPTICAGSSKSHCIPECGWARFLTLDTGDLDFVSWVLTVRDSKNSESRHIPMYSTVTALLKRTQPVPRCDYVFPNAASKRWNYSQDRPGVVIHGPAEFEVL
jgi:hypothetical protein